MLSIDADALETIVAHVPSEDHFPLALVHTALRDACLRHRVTAADGMSKNMWTTRATRSVTRTQLMKKIELITPRQTENGTSG